MHEDMVMKSVLSNYTKNRDNNFNLVRFAAALLVLYTHSYALSIGTDKAEPLRSLLGITWGTIAVDVFFITSGFLVTSSLVNRNNLLAFVWARFLRVYPALFVAVLFCVFLVGAYFTSFPVSEYLAHERVYKFLFNNATLVFGVEYFLPGVFVDVPYKYLVNGSLWTLPFELEMYGCLCVIGSALLFIQKRIKRDILGFAFLTLAVVSVAAYLTHRFYPYLSNGLFLRLFSMFFMGAAFYIWKDKIVLSTKAFFVILSALLLSILDWRFFMVMYHISLAYLVLYIAYVPAGRIRQFNVIGDYSYGIYIYAFPVQQSVAALIKGVSVPVMMGLSFIITLALAVLSWHLVEKRSLAMKGGYRIFEAKLLALRKVIWRAD